jgi:hypothetical protein
VPQLFFFSLLFTILAAVFSFEAIYGSGFTLWLVVLSVAMVAAFWYETLILWRKLTA